MVKCECALYCGLVLSQVVKRQVEKKPSAKVASRSQVEQVPDAEVASSSALCSDKVEVVQSGPVQL